MRAHRTGIDGTPDFALDAERWLVGGALLASPEAVLEAGRLATGDDFYDHLHGLVWNTLHVLAAAGKEPSIATVSYALNQAGKLDEVGGEPALVQLASDPLAFLYAGEPSLCAHAGIVADYGKRRRAAREQLQQAQEMARGAQGLITRGNAAAPVYMRPEYADELEPLV